MIVMERDLKRHLRSYSKRTISIDTLQEFISPHETYASFAKVILFFEEEDILVMVKARGRTPRKPSLANRYTINRQKLTSDYYKELQKYRFTFHLAIDLDAYFALDESVWLADVAYLEKINGYLTKNGLPENAAAAPERSFELVGDEKWIDEQGGAAILERVGLWDVLRIFPVSDPLMFAINPARMDEQVQLHLIVENKTTYQALQQVLTRSAFSTLIYGVGGKIAKGIENFHDQYPVEAQHLFLYFGDVDRSGISIWHVLNERQQVFPAKAFYEACFQKEQAFGKTKQRKNLQHVADFSSHFKEEMAERIKELIAAGAYYPQEVLRTNELQGIMLETNWRKVVPEMNRGAGC